MKEVIVNDLMQSNYKYLLTHPVGENFDREFVPELTPIEMLKLGVFGGKYMADCFLEFPSSWFQEAKISKGKKNIELNFFKIDASLPLKHWLDKGWIFDQDPRGWFQWYCRFCNGRRIPHMDEIQIKRWKNFRRHVLAIEKNCEKGDLGCRKRQRQAILQWAYDPYKR